MVTSQSLGLGELPSNPNDATARARLVCYDCFRPRAQCYCDELQAIDNRTQVLMLQHPRERFHPLGTARIVKRCLTNARLDVVRAARPPELLTRGLPTGSALLYPGPGARDLGSLPAHERPSTLVVLDGTWHHARSMFRDYPALGHLPRVSFVPRRPTEYRVRREPHVSYVSTVEAVAQALESLEPGLSCQPMLAAFRRMIDLHLLATTELSKRPRQRRERPASPSGIAWLLAHAPERVVLTYGEARPRDPFGPLLRHPPLVYLTAKRLGESAVFEQALSTGDGMSDRHLRLFGLGREHFAAACSVEWAARRWSSFVRNDDVLVAWNQSTLERLLPLPTEVPGIAVKGCYRGHPAARVAKGSLDDVVRGEGLQACRARVAGRAGDRLGQLEAVVRFMQGLPQR